MEKHILSAVRRARESELQAIAIYEAEVFWIRKPERRAILISILAEERAHDFALLPWSNMNPAFVSLNRITGWILGTCLTVLPWRWLCVVQDWAEMEASKIYAETLHVVGSSPDPTLLDRLAHARDQERAHAERFRSIVQALPRSSKSSS